MDAEEQHQEAPWKSTSQDNAQVNEDGGDEEQHNVIDSVDVTDVAQREESGADENEDATHVEGGGEMEWADDGEDTARTVDTDDLMASPRRDQFDYSQLFTEQSEDGVDADDLAAEDGWSEHASTDAAVLDDANDGADGDHHGEADGEAIPEEIEADQVAQLANNRAVDVSIEQPPATNSAAPTRPVRPSRASIPVSKSPTHALPSTCTPLKIAYDDMAPLQLITFDVGGRIFRCKANLIRKFPQKRLYQLIQCGCEQIAENTFFVDRNPTHFEIILDWYRTGKYIARSEVHEAALREDAKYFDLLDELFPPPPRRVPLAASAQQASLLPPRVQSRPSGGEVKPATSGSKRKDGFIYFCKAERRLLSSDKPPLEFAVRPNEQLIVESVQGAGKLLVHVSDGATVPSAPLKPAASNGVKNGTSSAPSTLVYVQQAVLYDSQSFFYMQGARVKLQHCILPGAFTYTFWMEKEAQATVSRLLGSNELDVEFKVISRFDVADEMTDVSPEILTNFQSMRNNLKAHIQPLPAVVQPPPESARGANSPEKTVPVPQKPVKPPVDADGEGQQRSPKKPHFAADEKSAPPRANARSSAKSAAPVKPAPQPQTQPQIQRSNSMIKRNGANIAIGNGGTEFGRVTVYQPEAAQELAKEQSRAKKLDKTSELLPVPAKTNYHDHQPRLFR
ncbi:TPA: hypothetical protein N0F65_004952 [Lagenidium giganteum]|uniref:Potassium channel tetramerisation-type BTB domain-containing protein n=1 Tax=Lagenidium giganteum TaxID=4803 RepID=A0AAV2YWW2_9STRA|nr:TPA: hypothetical protein N0F65_004952 [Lagenidium giganteum]